MKIERNPLSEDMDKLAVTVESEDEMQLLMPCLWASYITEDDLLDMMGHGDGPHI